MNIVVYGAGAIGSLFGGLLSKKNNVILIGRKPHVYAIKKNGLIIQGKTKLNIEIPADVSIDDFSLIPDLLILTVKSYDTENAIKEAKPFIKSDTVVMSLQNGLDNIEKIEKHIIKENIIVGITTNGAVFSKPGIIVHTGIGKTTLGELTCEKTKRITKIVDTFNKSGVKTTINNDILSEIWIKAIINSSINPLSTLIECKNGYLLKNPVLERIVEKICEESTDIANLNGINVSYDDMIERTKKVIKDTAENYSSMLQSFQQGKQTEIDSINCRLVEIGKKRGMEPLMNELLVYNVKSKT
jgi:2-dehydropantoate 2-reductase